MIRPLSRFRAAAATLFGVFFLLLLWRNAAVAAEGVRRGLSLCTETLLPSLFPFMALSAIWVALGVGETLERVFSRPVWWLFGISGEGAAAYILGVFCGFPAGIIAAHAAWQRGHMRAEEVRRLALFAGTPSPGFLVGAVGAALFGNRAAGAALFGMTLLSAAAVGIFVRAVFGAVVPKSEKKRITVWEKPFSATDMTAAVKNAFFAFLQVAAFVLFFSAATACLGAVLNAMHAPAATQVFLFGFLEITTGVSAALTSLSANAAFRICAFFAGFSGLSVCLQLFSLTEGIGLRPAPYLLAKTAQGTLNVLFCELYLRFAHPVFETARGAFADDAVHLAVRAFLPSVWVLAPLFAFGVLCAFLKPRKRKKER